MEKEKKVTPYEQDLLVFDPIVPVRDVMKQWLLILVVVMVVGCAAYIFADSNYTPWYRSSATLVVTNRSTNTTVYDNLSSATELAGVFSEVLNSSILRKTVLAEAGLSSFDGSISASAINSTNLMTVTVTSQDPKAAFQVLQAVLEHHDVLTYEILGDISLEILQKPTVPTAPYNSSSAARTTVVVMVLAAVAMCVLLFLLSANRDTVRSRREAEAKLNCWCMGEIHHERKHRTLKQILHREKTSILVSNPDTSFGYVSSIGRLCRRIQQHMREGKVLMVASVMENEGKSTVSVNIALTMAAKNKRVLLIDADLRKPSCRKILDREMPEYVVQDVILSRVPLEQAVQVDKRSGLHLLLAKKSGAENSADLIGSRGLASLLAQAREQYDLVILDLPPMSMTTDPESLMEMADASLLVVCQNVASAPAINRAVSVLQRGKAKLLGCVMNNVYATFLGSGEGRTSGYGYGYGYGHYGGYGKYDKYGSYGKYGKYGAYGAFRGGNGEGNDGN